MHIERHYFNPYIPFEGNETESQLRSFNLKLASTPLILTAWWSTNNNKQNMKMLDSLDVHNRATMVPIYYEFHYKKVAVASIHKNHSFSYLINKPRNLMSQSFLRN
jgi:hypothetical protein